MNKLLTINQAIKTSEELRKNGKSIVLAGGVFDILHIGHIRFLKKAKKKGDSLFVLLESDKTARKNKGENRPINTQSARAEVLSSIEFVDCVILLPEMKKDRDYDRLVTHIQPMYIAITEKDKGIKHKMRQAKTVGAKVLSVTPEIKDKSTTKIAKIIEEENNL